MSRTALLALPLAILGFWPCLAAATAQEAELTRVVQRASTLWAQGDAGALASMAARAGIAIDFEGSTKGPLAPRRAAAMLRKVFDDRETLSVRRGQAEIVGGAPQHAYAELEWVRRTRGTTIPERSTVFFGLVWEESGWRLTQIRVLR